jgi:tRNA pseudouridine55 synthase
MRDATATDGLLLVDKPAGVTSHDVVLAARRAFAEKRVGHAGTLDPFATGLLVLLFGRATRLLPHLDGVPKEYEAAIAFGRETDTDDLGGETMREAAAPTDDAIHAAIPQLTGTLHQLPPTYIRALARDLGRLCGSAAHLTALRRTRSGPFYVRDAVTLEQVREGRAALRPAIDAVPTIPRIVLAEPDAERVLRGIAVDRGAGASASPRAALVDPRSGALLALAEADGVRWQPRVVMHRVD